MTKIVGIDFGTANVRIAHWDDDSGKNAVSAPIGDGGVRWMPSVIAFQKQSDGKISVEVGETADRADSRNAPNAENTKVIRNIKRWALASDPYVHDVIEWTFQKQEDPWPKWFDHDTRSIRLWDETVMTAEEAITRILKEAISRSGLAGAAAEWRAGCPVESDLIYRKAMVSALDELGCGGQIKWVAEEPLLLLSHAKQVARLEDGRYLVYDLGGGSFDCAVVEVNNFQSDGVHADGVYTEIKAAGEHTVPNDHRAFIVLAQEGLMLGGADIDDIIANKLEGDGYKGTLQSVRIAKEQLSSGNRTIALDDGYELTLKDVEKAVEQGDFINRTITAMVNAYAKARILFPHDAGTTGGWNSILKEMVDNIRGVLLVGGPTRMDYFATELGKIFGAEKIIPASEIVQAEGPGGAPDPELTALSHGACYLSIGATPLTVDRIPANITLRVTDGHSTIEDGYEAFQRLPFRTLLAPHIGEWVALDTKAPKAYSVHVTDPDGELLDESRQYSMRMPRQDYLGPLADQARLVVDRLGGIKVNLAAGFMDVPNPMEQDQVIFRNPLWQPLVNPDEPIPQPPRGGVIIDGAPKQLIATRLNTGAARVPGAARRYADGHGAYDQTGIDSPYPKGRRA